MWPLAQIDNMALIHERVHEVGHQFMNALMRVMRGDYVDASTSVSSHIQFQCNGEPDDYYRMVAVNMA